MLVLELLDFIDDVVDELGSREKINYVHEIMIKRNWSRQTIGGFQ